jgi:alanyl-tRNA synthetase
MKRLYWTQPDVREAEVEVVAVGPGKVTIDPILFHPDEGGQPADKGTIGEAVVHDVQVVDGKIVHSLDRPLPDGKHAARLDKERRLYTATQHTAQHILSGIASSQFGLETVGVHIGLESCTVDFDKKVEWDVAEELERRAMEVVTLDLPVETTFNDQDMQARSRRGEGVPPLLIAPHEGRSKGKGTPNAMDRVWEPVMPSPPDVIRVVKIGEFDKSACCGAHVQSTGRIGVIRIFDLEGKKQGTRASFLAGRRALEQSQSETSILRELRKLAGCATVELPSTFQRAVERSKELAKEMDRIWSLRLSDLVKSTDVVTVKSLKVGVYLGELPRELVSVLAGMIAETIEGAGVVVSDTHIAISSRTLDAGGLLKEIQSTVGGKGGGSPKSANGRLNRPVTMNELVDIMRKE